MKKIINILIVLLPLLFSSCTSSEYDVFASVYGIVSDNTTGEPISGATVQLSPGGATQLTGSDGYFEFDDLTPQQYTVTVQKDGYLTNRKNVTAVLGTKTNANITLTK